MTRTAAAAFAAGALTIAFAGASDAYAQTAAPAPAAPLSAEDAAALRGELSSLKARIEDLERRLAASAPAAGDQPAGATCSEGFHTSP